MLVAAMHVARSSGHSLSVGGSVLVCVDFMCLAVIPKAVHVGRENEHLFFLIPLIVLCS